MRLGKLAVAIGMATALSSQGLSALGLGEIKLNSTLNQPLDAEISLLQVRDLGETEILAGLAQAQDFSRAGIERNYFLTGLKFTVDLKAPGGAVIRVRSDRQVQEPYLNFLVETRWPSGRILREYTLLMDLPVFAEDAAPEVQAARPTNPVVEPKAVVRPAPKPVQRYQREETPAVEPQPSSAAQSTSSYGPVGANETLWGIASQVRPGGGVSVQQTMLAIQRLNPDAFIDGNINLLRRGQVLRIPSQNEITSLTARQAVAQVARQNTDWSGNANGDISGAPIDAAPSRSQDNERSQQSNGRVTLASGGDQGSGSGAGNGTSSAQLSQAMELLDKSRRENDELNSRVKDLEAQIETMERLVSVSSDQLRTLQLAAANGDEQNSSAEDVAEAATIDPLNDPFKSTVDEQTANLDGDTEQGEGVDSESLDNESLDSEGVDDEGKSSVDASGSETSSDVAKDEPKATRKVASVVSTPTPEPGILDMIMDNLLWIGGGLLAVLVGVWALLRGRRPEDEDEEHLEPLVTPSVEPAPEAAAEVDEKDLLSGATEDGEAVSEADIYIAYGKFDQAETLLKGFLVEQPTHSEARLKLLEVYSETRNYDDFDAQFTLLQENGDSDAIERAQSLRDSMGDPSSASDALDALGLDLGDAHGEEQTLDDLDLGDMDFDLGDEGAQDSGLSLADEAVGEFEIDAADDSESSGELSDVEFDLALGLEPEGDQEQAADGAVDFESAAAELDELQLDSVDAVAPDALSSDDNTDEPNVIEFESGLDLSSDNEESELELSVEGLDLDTNFGADFSEELEDGPASTEDDVFAELEDISSDEQEDALAALDDLDLDLGESSSNENDNGLGLGAVAAAGVAAVAATALANDDSADASEATSEGLAPLDQADDDLSSLDSSGQGLDFSPDFANELESDLSDELSLDTDGDFDLEALDKELDSELGLDDDVIEDLGAELNLDAPEASELDDVTSMNVGDLAATGMDDGDDLAALDISLGDVSGDMEVAPPSAEESTGPAGELDSELEFLAESDEVATKLDLARAYMDMGDQEGAKEILEEVQNEGDEQQRGEASELIERM